MEPEPLLLSAQLALVVTITLALAVIATASIVTWGRRPGVRLRRGSLAAKA